MSDQVSVLPEPSLEFRHRQGVVDPHMGLTLFGPFDADRASPPAVSYALIGTPEGVESFVLFVDLWQPPIATPHGMDGRLWPMFPGFEAAFGCRWPVKPTRTFHVAESDLDTDTRHLDPNQRAAAVVGRYVCEIEKLAKGDERPAVVVCVVPDFVYDRCRPQSRIPRSIGLGRRPAKKERRERERGQMDLFNSYDPAIYQFSPDFRRQLKARTMEFELPVQIIQRSTLILADSDPEGRRSLTCLADRAWNLGVGLYYKSGGKPWRLHTAREGVCYIGLAYRKKDPQSGSPTAACAAQMFLDSGDGIVFMGEFGPWYSLAHDEFHMTRTAAKELLEGVLNTYRDQGGPPLKEVFLHCRSGINPEEFAGFKDACPAGVALVGVRVRKERRDVRLMREGRYPVLRGTLWRVSDRLAFLWGSGLHPTLGTYTGPEIPLPLRIEIQHGTASIAQVATDILALTKLNYNACRIGDAEPVTVGFSDAVGEILVSNPGAKNRKPNFKYYI